MANETEQPPELPKLLVVDDDPSIIALLKGVLPKMGFSVETAVDGVEGLEKVKSQTFTLVLTDLLMPRMDGMTLLKEIKNYNPRLDVIVITGYAANFSYTDVVRAGASDFIIKPFSINELEAKIRRVLREQELIRKLEELSLKDTLTGVYNRRGFELKIQEEATRTERLNYPVFLALIDLDKFKPYNDQYGHQAGDEVLKAVGKLLESHTRHDIDWCCRQGGDEFAVIIPSLNEQQAITCCERFITEFARIPFGETAMSIGLAKYIRHPGKSKEQSIEDLIERADQAMYKAKENGGSQVFFNQD